MERAFFTRAPNDAELRTLSRYLGTFRDGSGAEREKDDSTRAGSRQIERCFAELLHGKTTEDKSFYDFVIESNEGGGIAIRGASIKSKEKPLNSESLLPARKVRAHLEISNSSSKDWALCEMHGLSHKDFGDDRHAETFGKVVLARQIADREQAETDVVAQSKGVKRTFISKESIFISVLYTRPQGRNAERQWMVSVFPINLPPPAKWGFRAPRPGFNSSRALLGYDADGGTLYEWYGLSGGQLKYFPKLTSRLWGTSLFDLPKPIVVPLRRRADDLFGG